MTLRDIQFIFNRALTLTFSKKKILFVFTILALCGLMVVFFRALSLNAGQWILLSLTFMPYFLSAGVLLSTGIMLIRIYHDEIKKKEFRYRDILANSWEIIIGASYFAIPIIISYLLLWMLLGIFVLLSEVPGLGEFFAVVLAFAPFLLNLGAILLALLSLSLLFFAAPVLALNGMNRARMAQIVASRIQEDPFSNLFLGSIALLPLLVIFGILFSAALLTGVVCFNCVNPVSNVLQAFFIMIPFAALLSPAVIFYFNFAAESHVLILKGIRNRNPGR